MVPLEFGSDIGGSIRVPAAFCGLFGHKPSFGLIPSRGHAPPGVDGAGIPLAVVGPLARTAADLALALGATAGPDRQDARAYGLALPPMRRTGLADYRVLILDAHPVAAVDGEIRAALDGLGRGLARRGAYVTRSSDRLPDLAKAHEIYGGMMGVAMSRGGPEPSKATAHEWMGLLDGQEMVRRAWAAFFEEIDVVLAPAMGAVAFPHTVVGPETANSLIIDGQPTPYFAQLAWPGMATLANLPATAIPIGQTKAGLPIGAQVIGPYLEDLTTIGFAGLVEREFGGFVPPNL
jgi:amidase